MKKNLVLFLLSVCSWVQVHSQNLVPNPSFEDTVACPTNLTQINLSSGWSSYGISPDYFNSCSIPGTVPGISVTVPNNQWGYQPAKSGEAYAGCITFSQWTTNIREYIGCELIQTLIIGVKYFVSFYVSPAKGANHYPSIASNKIGVRLSTVAYSSNNPPPLNNFAHVFTNQIITDTISWTKIEASFIADSAYQYVSLGNFYDDQNTSIIFLDTVPNVAYYYVDDIKLSTDSIFVNSISELSENYFRIYPVPVEDELTIELNLSGNISIVNSLGQEIYKQNNISNSTKINFSKFPKGLYFVRIKTRNGVISKKILKI